MVDCLRMEDRIRQVYVKRNILIILIKLLKKPLLT